MAQQPARPIEGVVFPTNDKGERSTSDAQKQIFAAVLSKTDAALAEEVKNERNWRYKYNRYILKHVQGALKSPEAAVNSAQAGLDWIHNNFEFIRDGKTYKFSEAMNKFTGSYQTGVVKGKQAKPDKYEYTVPYKGRTLTNESLLKKLTFWAKYGTIESDTADAISSVVKNNKWCDLSDLYIVLLGAGSAMGPYSILMSLGANVIAIDLDRPQIWKRLISIAENSTGTLTFPLKKPQSEIKSQDELFENAGSNLITQAPEILNWLKTVYPDKKLVVGNYVYLDGENFVKVALACDGITKGLCESRKAGIAFLCTPTDVHVITDEARRASASNYNSLDWRNLTLIPLRTIAGLVAGGKYLAKNTLPTVKSNDGNEFSIVDGLVVPQGPNYALAKRMQHWRSVVEKTRGNFVSTHIAPSSTTASVVHNKTFAWVYDGITYFRPYEIFDQETSNAVMAAILIHDIRNPKAPAQPEFRVRNPYELFKYVSFHGGVWRSGYRFQTIGEVSAIIHFIKVARPILVVLLLVVLYFFVFRRFL